MEFSPTLIVGDCRCVMYTMPENSIDLIVTSPPYNCKIKYDNWDDELQYEDYLKFMEEWLRGAYRVLRPDGRIALNLYYESSYPDRGGRAFVSSDVWQIMKGIGYKWNGIADLKEVKPERINYCAWGSWMSASAPYMYNPKECVIVACKNIWKKSRRGTSTIGRDEFLEAVKGEWAYRAVTSAKTEACFSLDIPMRAIDLFTYVGDTVLDPFCGRGTTGVACKLLDRKFIGIDISPRYIEIAKGEIPRMTWVNPWENGRKV